MYNGSHLTLSELKSSLAMKIDVEAADENAVINIELERETGKASSDV